MGNALRDQLLKAGLVNEKQVKKVQQDKRKEDRQAQGKPAVSDAQKADLQMAQMAKAERDRQLNRERQLEQEQKARQAQARQIIEAHRLPLEEGETPYNIVDGGKVKKLYLSEKLKNSLVRGRSAIVKLDGKYALVEAEIASRIAERDASFIVLFNAAGNAGPKDDHDPYAAYAVPDDLVW